MALQIRQLHPLFAGEATGIDLRDLTDRTAIDAIAPALDRYGVLVFREQMLGFCASPDRNRCSRMMVTAE